MMFARGLGRTCRAKRASDVPPSAKTASLSLIPQQRLARRFSGASLSIRKAFILRKTSFYEYKGKVAPGSYAFSVHQENLRAASTVAEILSENNIDFHVAKFITKKDVDWADLVITVGGDGTFLTGAHSVSDGDKTPMLGVNSSPSTSYGNFKYATASTFREKLQQIIAGTSKPRPLWRMSIAINDEHLPLVAANDCLISGINPAASIRYRLEVNGISEQQRASGMWVATSAGSTGGIHSAGGLSYPLHERRLQFRAREPMKRALDAQEPRTSGLAHSITLHSLGSTGSLFVDGQWKCFPFHESDKLTFEASPYPLMVFL